MTSLILPLDLNRYADQEGLELKQLQITLDMFRIVWKMNHLLIDCWSTGDDVRIWTFCLFIYHYFFYAVSIGQEAGYAIFMLRVG